MADSEEKASETELEHREKLATAVYAALPDEKKKIISDFARKIIDARSPKT